MSKKCYRYFGGLLKVQEKWLNHMADKGYRLIKTGRLCYEFVECSPKEVIYCVDFVASKSSQYGKDYQKFLEDFGYHTFFKNINLNYSFGKLRWRPWADKGGQIATNSTTYDKEILIVEKKNDGMPFKLHTSYEDKISYYRSLRNMWLFLFVFLFGMLLLNFSWFFGLFITLFAVPAILYQVQLTQYQKASKTNEW